MGGPQSDPMGGPVRGPGEGGVWAGVRGLGVGVGGTTDQAGGLGPCSSHSPAPPAMGSDKDSRI
jgi:hypothetical protein